MTPEDWAMLWTLGRALVLLAAGIAVGLLLFALLDRRPVK